MKWFLRLIGLAEKEYHHLAAGVLSLSAEFKALADRKADEASDLAVEIRDKTVAKDEASTIAVKARSAAAKFEALVS